MPSRDSFSVDNLAFSLFVSVSITEAQDSGAQNNEILSTCPNFFVIFVSRTLSSLIMVCAYASCSMGN